MATGTVVDEVQTALEGESLMLREVQNNRSTVDAEARLCLGGIVQAMLQDPIPNWP